MAIIAETRRLGIQCRILQALRHARFGIWTMALTYVLSVLVGVLLVHSGNRYSLEYRDKLVGRANRESPILRQLQHGHSLNDNNQRNRLLLPSEAFYYLTTLRLQLLPYSLCGGAGVSVGITSFASASHTGYHGARVAWLRIPYEALRDAGRIYLFSLPLFAVASLFEFLMS